MACLHCAIIDVIEDWLVENRDESDTFERVIDALSECTADAIFAHGDDDARKHGILRARQAFRMCIQWHVDDEAGKHVVKH